MPFEVNEIVQSIVYPRWGWSIVDHRVGQTVPFSLLPRVWPYLVILPYVYSHHMDHVRHITLELGPWLPWHFPNMHLMGEHCRCRLWGAEHQDDRSCGGFRWDGGRRSGGGLGRGCRFVGVMSWRGDIERASSSDVFDLKLHGVWSEVGKKVTPPFLRISRMYSPSF